MKKSIQKTIVFFLLLVLAFSLCACGKKEEVSSYAVPGGNQVFIGQNQDASGQDQSPDEQKQPPVEQNQPPADQTQTSTDEEQTSDEQTQTSDEQAGASSDEKQPPVEQTDTQTDEDPAPADNAEETGKKNPNVKPVYTGFAAEEHPKYIVHAGGEYHKYSVTNSIDSFTMAYNAGQRYLEIDFTLTRDGYPVCLHDWNIACFPEYTNDDFPLTLEQYEGAAMYGFMTPMTVADLSGFMNDHNDFYVITDGKKDCLTVLQIIAETYPSLRDRYIVQVYDMESIPKVQAMGYSRIILTLYELPNEIKTNAAKVAELVKGYDLWAITFDRVLTGYEGYVDGLLATNNRLYTHTVNDEAEIQSHLNMGITGVYTDRYFEE